MVAKWDRYRTLHPDYIKNNPGVEKCKGCFIRTINGKTKRFFCQLTYIHTGECINFSGRKKWTKGFKEVIWDQLEIPLQKNPGQMNLDQKTEEALTEGIDTALQTLDSVLNPSSPQE